MSARITQAGLSIADEIYRLVNDEIAPGTGVDPAAFWKSFAAIVSDLAPKNRELLEKRRQLQQQINAWHHQHPGPIDLPVYKRFLGDIGYLVPEGGDFQITTANVDPEISSIAGSVTSSSMC